MPRRELRYPSQVENWLQDWGGKIHEPAELVLIGSGGLLWHAAQAGIEIPLPENSMDVDPVTDSDEVAFLGYEAMIGSEFEKEHGWHVNLMPAQVLNEKCRPVGGTALPAKTTAIYSRWFPLSKTSCIPS